MAKTPGKKPAKKSNKTAKVAVAKSVAASKKAAPSSKSTPKPAKKVIAKSKVTPVSKPVVKPAAVVKFSSKTKPDLAPPKRPEREERPIQRPALRPAAVSKSQVIVANHVNSNDGSAAVNGKPVKQPSPFSARDLDHFRSLLLAKRHELIGDMSSMEREALRGGGGSNLSNLPIHMADMGTDNYEQEFTLGLVQKDRDLLKEINSALTKIQGGTYGFCEATGQPINRERLEYQPWAKYSVEHQRKLEQYRR